MSAPDVRSPTPRHPKANDHAARTPTCCGHPMTVARDHGETALLRCLTCFNERHSRGELEGDA